ncbi:hypothetical protein Z043_123914, partial [Scleropages formosus]
ELLMQPSAAEALVMTSCPETQQKGNDFCCRQITRHLESSNGLVDDRGHHDKVLPRRIPNNASAPVTRAKNTANTNLRASRVPVDDRSLKHATQRALLGVYVCSKCGNELFSSRSKFKHSSPWPAFSETIHENSVSKYLERPGAFK